MPQEGQKVEKRAKIEFFAILASKTQFFEFFFWQTTLIHATLCVTKHFQLFSTQFHENLIGTTLPVHCVGPGVHHLRVRGPGEYRRHEVAVVLLDTAEDPDRSGVLLQR